MKKIRFLNIVVNAIIVLAALGFGFLAFKWIVESPTLFNAWHIIAIVATALSVLMVAGLVFSAEAKRNLLIITLVSIGSIVLCAQVFKFMGGGSLFAVIDFYVGQELNTSEAKRAESRERPVRPFPALPIDDIGNTRQFLDQMRQFDTMAYRFITPHFLLNLADSGHLPLFPLSGIARVWSPVCNEGDQRQYPIIRADRFGFNNEDTVYVRFKDRTMLLGDSYVYGFCVHQEQTIAGVMRRNGIAAISAGTGGSGPFTNFAILREYGAVLKPKSVAWVHFERNDFPDMRDRELRSKYLLRYLEDDFSQNLTNRQREVDTFWKGVFGKPGGWDELVSAYNLTVERWRDAGMPTDPDQLARVRSLLGIQFLETLTEDEDLVEVFVALMAKARDTAAAWGGELYFVPVRSQLTYRGIWQESHFDEVMERVANLGIPVVDIDRVIRSTGDPLQFFPVRNGESHFNPLGYQLVARELATAIDGRAKVLGAIGGEAQTNR